MTPRKKRCVIIICQIGFGTSVAHYVALPRKTEAESIQKTINKLKHKETMTIKPLSDRVLVLPNPAEEKTVGGLFIPDSAKEKPLMGKVVAVGPGTADIKMEVKEGDTVLYGKFAGTELNIDGVDYLIMRQNDILAVY